MGDTDSATPLTYKAKVAIIYVVAVFIQILDSTMVNVAVPTIAREFAVGAVEVDRAIIGYFLALAIVIPMAGALSERFGDKRLFVTALVGFAALSMLAGSSQSLTQFMVFRVLQGCFAGVITPVGGAMLYAVYPPAERARISAVVGAVVLASPALGPAIGGVLIEFLVWRSIFFVTVPAAAFGAVLCHKWLQSTSPDRSAGVDVTGVVLTATSIGPLLYAISEGPRSGWSSATVVSTAAVGFVSCVALVLVEKRVANPVVALGLFRDRLFLGATTVGFPAFASFFGVIFLLPLFLQEVGGRGPAITGVIMFFQPLGIIISSQFAGRTLYNRHGPRPLMTSGCAVAFAATLALATISDTTNVWFIVAILVVRGVGMGFVFIPVQTAAFTSIRDRDLGRASSLFNAQRQVAVALGIAIAATIVASLASTLEGLEVSSQLRREAVRAFRIAFAVSAAGYFVGMLSSLRVDNDSALDGLGQS